MTHVALLKRRIYALEQALERAVGLVRRHGYGSDADELAAVLGGPNDRMKLPTPPSSVDQEKK